MISFLLTGVTARLVTVEARPGPFDVRGLEGREHARASARETRVRVRSACAQHGLEPGGVVTLPGPGAHHDLAVALAALGKTDLAAFGELSLAGEVRAVRGLVPALIAARDAGYPRVLVPASQWREASLVPGFAPGVVVGVRHLDEASTLAGGSGRYYTGTPIDYVGPKAASYPCLSDLAAGPGTEALIRAARERLSVLFVGPPGSGKTMLARRLPGLLPDLSPDEALEIAAIASAAGLPVTSQRPFRAPHHTVSTAGLVGGGTPVRPGEVTLAHHGVLFLDELPEFRRDTILELTQALRAGSSRGMPARPILVGAMNPCPCGYADRCACSAERIATYHARTPTGLFELVVELPRVAVGEIVNAPRAQTSASVRAETP